MEVEVASDDDNEGTSPYSNEFDVGKITAKVDKLEQEFEGCKDRYLKNTYCYIVSAIEKLRTDIVNNPNELEGPTKDMEVLQDYLKDEVDKVKDSSDDGGDDDDDDDDKDNANENNNIDTNETDNNTSNDSTSNANNDKKREKQNLF